MLDAGAAVHLAGAAGSGPGGSSKDGSGAVAQALVAQADDPDGPAAWLGRFASVQAPPHDAIIIGAALVGLALVTMRGPWRLARTVVTLVHEAGHALVAVLAGRRLQGILLHSDTSGLTVSRGKPTGPGMVLTALAGYPAPSLVGLGFSGLIAADRPGAVLLVAAVGTLGVLVMIRNVYGAVAVVAVTLGLGAVAYAQIAELTTATAYVVTWLLVLGAPRAVGELWAKRRRGAARDSDVDQLARLTELPAVLWLLMLVVLTVVALGAAGLVLLTPVFGGPLA